MRYRETVSLKDGRECVLRSGTKEDGAAALENFLLTHRQTEYLLTYPEENRIGPEEEGKFLQETAEEERALELLAEVDGVLAGMAGFDSAGNHVKTRHRAEFGVSVDRQFWGLGIGRALTEACIRCARQAGYKQLELNVVADNARAMDLYRSLGFEEFGRNPRGFRTRDGRYQELVFLRLEL